MSSVSYGNGNVITNDDLSTPAILSPSSEVIIQRPYLTSDTYAAVSISSATAPSLSQYHHRCGHTLPQQHLLHVQKTSTFYPTATLNHFQHHGDFSNSPSSSDLIKSSCKTTNRKRFADKTTISTKSNTKRKPVCLHSSL